MKNLNQSPFVGLFEKHPWLPHVLMMLRRLLGIIFEFIETNVKPFTKQ